MPHTLHGHLDNVHQRVYLDMWRSVYCMYGEGKLPTTTSLQVCETKVNYLKVYMV